jgi:hypothetical protein
MLPSFTSALVHRDRRICPGVELQYSYQLISFAYCDIVNGSLIIGRISDADFSYLTDVRVIKGISAM